MQHWYVYYKLPCGEVEQTAVRVRAMQTELAAATAVHGRLLRRVEQGGDTLTLMEQYDRIDDPHVFAARLAAAVERADLPAGALAQRRIERFEDF